MEINKLTEKVIGSAIEVHKALGPGLLESAYEQCLARELKLSGINFESQVPLPVEYKGVRLDCGYRVDFLIEKSLILELKSVEEVSDIHKAQLLTYMKLAKIKIGLLINFNPLSRNPRGFSPGMLAQKGEVSPLKEAENAADRISASGRELWPQGLRVSTVKLLKNGIQRFIL